MPMPLTLKQLKVIAHHSQLVEMTGTDYAEITLVYSRPFWKHLKLMTRDKLPKQNDTTEEGEPSHANNNDLE